jgi:NAD(P)-dependent dehydrogenase (short-subunit alcohol dehydrogenase family)
MEGKRCLVTGATAGIGLTIATALAEMGAEVILVSRNKNKCQQVMEKVQEDTGNPKISYFQADLSSQEKIKSLAVAIKREYSSLDVLINNAGGFFWRRQESVDGIEMTFALNHLNYFLLSNLLLDILAESRSARIVNVSSDSHQTQSLDFGNLQLKTGYLHFKAYGRSKLANLYFTYELARRLTGKKITVNAYNPSFTATNIAKDNFLGKIFMPLVNRFAIPVEQGAETGIFLAYSNEVEGISGNYFYEKKPIPSSEISYDKEIARQLWEVSVELTGLS